jgi:hypothetical protein
VSIAEIGLLLGFLVFLVVGRAIVTWTARFWSRDEVIDDLIDRAAARPSPQVYDPAVQQRAIGAQGERERRRWSDAAKDGRPSRGTDRSTDAD